MSIRIRAYARLVGLVLAVLGVFDTLILSTAGINTPINPRFDQAALYIGIALLLFGA